MDPADSSAVPAAPAARLKTGGLRWQIADLLLECADRIVADAVAIFPFSGHQRLETEYCTRIGHALIRLLSDTVRAAAIDARSGGVSDFAVLAAERAVPPEQLFTFAYLALSTAIDEMSLDPELGASTEPWPQAAQTIRRAMFEVLGAWATRSLDVPTTAAITDGLTTLQTRPVLEVALGKECHRAERFEHWLSMILLDIDNLSAINRAHGFGVGDRILERMGILTRTYFRQHDWVARYSEDSVAVLLPETSPEDALALAERARAMVHDRLTFRDYRTDERASVTASVAVASARAVQGEPIDAQHFLDEAEAALERAQTTGRNKVVQVVIPPRLMSVDEAAQTLNTTLEGIERLVGEGKLDPVTAGRHVRLERAVVEELARTLNS